MSDLVARLRHLVSLNERKNGGPYQGAAAEACVKAMGEAADLIESQAAKIAELERQLSIMTASRDGYAKQDAARLAIARNEVIEEIAAWVEPQRVVIPAHGWEFAAAIRALKKGEQA